MTMDISRRALVAAMGSGILATPLLAAGIDRRVSHCSAQDVAAALINGAWNLPPGKWSNSQSLGLLRLRM
jgi:hypothetical protein